KKARFYRSNIDHEVKVLIENCDKKANLSKGMSENYIPVVLPDTQVKENSIVTVRIQKVESDLTVIGTIALNARI
ncbi:MAG: hypothetical protein PVI54_05770, partial [Desulfobacteraceae bacterium]